MFSKKINRISFVLAFTAMLCFHPDASAQRQIPGQFELSFKFDPVMTMGGNVELAVCNFSGKMFGGLNYYRFNDGSIHYDMTRMNLNGKLVDDAMGELREADTDKIIYDRMSFRSHDVFASVGYEFRLVSNRSRSATLFLGASFDCGMRFLEGDPSSIVYKNEFEESHRNDFAYPGFRDGYQYKCFTTGFTPVLEMELSIFKRTSVSFYFDPRIILVNPYGRWLNLQGGVGVNFYIIRR